jgi:hypothetical protein
MEILVKLKTWEQMAKENRIDADGDIVIDTAYMYFTKGMEEIVAKIPNRVIKVQKSSKYRYPQWETEYDTFDISEGMIEEYLNPNDHSEYYV